MKTSIRNLRNSMKIILTAVQHGEEVVIYSHKLPIAKIVPLKKKSESHEDEAFGMWDDYAAIKNVDKYVRRLRKGRRHDI